MINLESKWNKISFPKRKMLQLLGTLNSFLNSSNVKRPNSNYEIFVEKRACKEREET